MSTANRIATARLALFVAAAVALPIHPVLVGTVAAGVPEVVEHADRIEITTSQLQATINKSGYVSGVAGGTLVDRRTGTRDLGFGLDVVDWIMEPGSDAAYRTKLADGMAYEFNNLYHGQIPKRCVEGPQICTQARQVSPEIIRGPDFVALRMSFRYHLAAPGRNTGSLWTQTLVFPDNQRYFISSDRIDSVNDGEALFLRVDMPGHIKHDRGDSFEEVYLSYHGYVASTEFVDDFAPDARFRYVRDDQHIPQRMIRAYRPRPAAGQSTSHWLAGMTLDPGIVSEAWCHQRGYVCMIEEFGGRPVRSGESFQAAFVVGFFDSVQDMESVFDRYRGTTGLAVDAGGWRTLP